MILIAVLVGQATSQSLPNNQRAPSAPGVVAGREFPMTILRHQCLEFAQVKHGDKPGDLRDCRVSEFAEFGSIDGQTYYYALYCLIPNLASGKGSCNDDSFNARYYRERGLAIFVADALNGNASLLFERVEGEIGRLRYSQPQIIKPGAETLLYLPIAIEGNANENVSEYFLQDGGTWVPIESVEWFQDLLRRIPAGLEIRKGVWPNLQTMTAVAHLYRPADNNASPTGGTARIALAIRSRHFVITSFVIEDAR
jgi:hypothetical protein